MAGDVLGQGIAVDVLEYQVRPGPLTPTPLPRGERGKG
jgi:hypothetical protein